MYCVKCGVELTQGAKVCPLCGTRVYHPDIKETPEPGLYPRFSEGEESFTPGGFLFIVTFIFAIPIVLCLLIDLNMHGEIIWSGYSSCGLATLYVIVCLPLWFKKKNPVIFVPASMTALLLCALYINVQTGGNWFLSFAFPVGGALILLVEAVVVLCWYCVGPHRHRLMYILGGALILLGGWCMLLEFLILVFFVIPMKWWSLYPMTALGLLGILMIIIGVNKPLRKSLHKKLFV